MSCCHGIGATETSKSIRQPEYLSDRYAVFTGCLPHSASVPSFCPSLVLKDSQTGGRLTLRSGISAPSPFRKQDWRPWLLRELGPFLILRSEVARGMECGYVVLAPVAFQQGRLRTAPVTLATGAVSYSEKGKCNHQGAKTTVVNAHEIRNAVPISFIHSQ